ncbi:MAG: alpha-amylase family glycosyl hydrolase [Saprospiraceae bacterium]|nr:alpha-amylase family glycosyl hydrolase [Saprospiraceae bacterium]
MKNMALFFISVIAIALIWHFFFQKSKEFHIPKTVKPNIPDWHKNATIYEVNLRQFTKEGTFAAFQKHLPRLKELGVDILWLMPIHPISKKNRKGELGSPYAVGDYYEVNPDFGTMSDFKTLLAEIHQLGMHCIIDWVPNHSGWDNPWIKKYPEYYQKKDGKITDPINKETGESWGWTDVAAFDFSVPAMRLAMIDAMKFWINDIGIDGFRVDVAHGVPVDFWAQCTDALYQEKAIFFLAEAEVPAIVNNGAFVMDYGWEMHHTLNEIARTQGMRENAKNLVQGNLVEDGDTIVENHEPKTALDIDRVFAKKDTAYHRGYQMHFTSNHDENSWAGTEFQRMGEGHKAFAVLTATFDGMPLIYTGQESALKKQLDFFGKDEVEWSDYAYTEFYQTLFDLKHRNQALWNGQYGGKRHKIKTGVDEAVYAFTREKNGDKVVVWINLSNEEQIFTLKDEKAVGDFTKLFTNEKVQLTKGKQIILNPWEYAVYTF